MNSNNVRSYFGMGAISLVVIIVVLAIACFATLTFASANSDYKLSIKSANAVKEYYAADTEAVRISSEIQSSIKSSKLQQKAEELGCTISEETSGTYVYYSVAISENKNLDVRLKITDNYDIQIEKWQTVIKTH